MNIMLRPVLLSIISGIILLLVPIREEGIRKFLSLVLSLIILITAINVIQSINSNIPLRYFKPILAIGGFNLNLNLFISFYRSVLGSIISFFGFIIVLYSIGFEKIKFKKLYYPFLLWAEGFAILVVFANNLFLFIISWEIVTLILFFLISFGQTKKSFSAAAKMFIINGAADLLMLLGFILLWKISGKITITEICVQIKSPIHYISCFLILIGALTKAGAMPFHSWVPTTCDNAPLPVAAFLPAAIDKLLGIYLLTLTTINLFKFNPLISNILMSIGAITILLAVLFALVQHSAKKLLAFHAISQVGYMVIGIGTGHIIGIIGGVYHMINNMIYKSCLFLGTGAVEKQTGETDLSKLGGLGRNMPITFTCMSIAALSIAGLPPFNGFVSKWLIYNGIISINRPVFLIVAMFGSALTLASFIKLIHSLFLGNVITKYVNIKEVKISMLFPMILLALLCIGLGLLPQLVFTHIINNGYFARHGINIAAGLVPESGNWSPIYAVLLMLVSYFIGMLIYIIFTKSCVRRTRTFVGGEIFTSESTQVDGTHFFLTIRNLPILKTIYKDSEQKSYDLYTIIDRCGAKIISILRKLHNGILPTYLAWCIIGIIAMIFIFTKFSGL